MKFSLLLTFIFTLILFVYGSYAEGEEIKYIEAKPLTEVVTVKKAPLQSSGKLKIPLITWGGDVATILAHEEGIFKDENLDEELFLENNFPKQVTECLSGKTPFLRGTMGMINSAAEVLKKNGLDLVVIYQMTWSVGGDCMVVRKDKNLNNIEMVALQLYGPHMDYAANLFQSANRLDKVKFKWLSELTLPSFDTQGKIIDPVSAFQKDSTLDAAMCIIPDGLMLTSGGKGGTGAEGSVKGAKVLLSTKTADRVIADVYAVRSDYFSKNKADVQRFVHALLRGQEALSELKKDKSQQAKYRQLLGKAADLLLGAPQATSDIEALLADCRYVGHSGNVQFFTGTATTRSLKIMTDEIQKSFITLGLMKSKIPLRPPEWDYAALARGLKYAAKVAPAKPKFDPQKAQALVEKKISAEPATWESEGTLFKIEINFEPNQSNFSDTQYADDYQKAVQIAQTYGGSLIVVEGHSDPLGILRAKQKGKAVAEIAQMEQAAKNLSLQRAQEVRKSFLSFAEKNGLSLDKSQFIAVGMGISSPKFNPPKTKEEWAANRRVVFRIKQIEAEMNEFVPLD
jgi:outer membrane protein OmpA-like peptidoglycan-associated protein